MNKVGRRGREVRGAYGGVSRTMVARIPENVAVVAGKDIGTALFAPFLKRAVGELCGGFSLKCLDGGRGSAVGYRAIFVCRTGFETFDDGRECIALAVCRIFGSGFRIYPLCGAPS